MTAPALTLNAWLRWDVVGPRVAELAPRSVLEFGCGLAAVGSRLADGRLYRGIEPDETSRAVAAARLPVTGRVLASAEELDVTGFDLVVAFEVLEHVPDDEAELRGWAGHARPGGHVVLSVPAGPERYGPHDALAGHRRRYTCEALSDVARRAGLAHVEIVPVGFPLGLALEAVRNRLATRDGRSERSDHDGVAERTASSARIRQPPAWAGPATAAVSWPFRVLQRRAGDRGPATGLVLFGARPTDP